MTSRRSHISSTASAFVLLLLGTPLTVTGEQSFQTTPTTFSGQATVVKGTIAGIPITLVETGPVDAGGGALEAHLLCYPAAPDCVIGLPDLTNGVLTVEVLNASVVAQGNRSRAAASVAELSLEVGGQQISAGVLRAEAEAQCADGTAFIRGEATIAELVINGETIAITGEVNQRIPLPGGGVVIVNEQVASMTAGNGDVTVRALHIMIPGVLPGSDTDVVIAEAHASIACGQRFCPADRDFVTSGGRLADPKRNFAVAGGIKNGAFWGHLLYVNHQTRLKAKGTGVTAYVITGPTTRHIEGTAEINGQPGMYHADVDDQGEPGRRDVIRLTLSNGETAVGRLDGGNIQLHTCK